jgi:hypothetical protein
VSNTGLIWPENPEITCVRRAVAGVSGGGEGAVPMLSLVSHDYVSFSSITSQFSSSAELSPPLSSLHVPSQKCSWRWRFACDNDNFRRSQMFSLSPCLLLTCAVSKWQLEKHFLADDITDGRLWIPQLPHLVVPHLAPFFCALDFLSPLNFFS